MRTRATRWTKEKVFDVLKEFWDIAEYDDKSLGNDIIVEATSERPSILYDDVTRKLYLWFPNVREELPNPNTGDHYPDFYEAIDEAGSVEDALKEYFSEGKVKEIVSECKGREGEDYLDCVVDRAYDEYRQKLAKELEKRAKELENSRKEARVFCNVPVTKTMDVYSETRYDSTGNEYTAYMPAELYIIDLDKVPDESTLKCILEEVINDTRWLGW